MRKWLLEASNGKAQYVAGGAMWAIAVVAMLAFGYGGCFAHGAEAEQTPGAVAAVKSGVAAGAVTPEDFASLLPPGVTPFVLPATAPAASAATVEAEAGGSAEAHWGWWVITTDMAQTVVFWIIGTGIPAVLAWLYRRWQWLQGLDKAFRCFIAGVRDVYDGYVMGIKLGRADGKLTVDERREAVNRAIFQAKVYAREQGIDLLKYYAESFFPVLVDKAVKWLKGEKAPLA